MKKLVVRAAALALVLGGIASQTPGHAARTYTIRATRAANVADGKTVFSLAKCNSALVGSPVDGHDTAFIDVRGRGGTAIKITWTGEVLAGGVLGSGLIPTFFDGACNQFNPAPPASGVVPGAWTINAPAGAAWLTVTSNGVNNVRITL